MNTINNIKNDPKMLIFPPYWDCPNCSDKNCFGVANICERSYRRICTRCRFDFSYALPELNKKVIYIDQFAISNMMKSLYPKFKVSNVTINSFYDLLFSKLNRLNKLQLIVCPKSSIHDEETSLYIFNKHLNKFTEYLSNGISFMDNLFIEEHQILNHALYWLTGDNRTDINVNEVSNGETHTWLNNYIISFDNTIRQEDIKKLLLKKEQVHQDFISVFNTMAKSSNSFQQNFKNACNSIGPYFLQSYYKYCIEREDIQNGYIKPTI